MKKPNSLIVVLTSYYYVIVAFYCFSSNIYCLSINQAAAERLATHWSVRREIFGDERAFLPMTLAGAMKDDLFQVQQGYVTPMANDEHGRPVLFLDRVGSTKSPTYNRGAYLRTLWYCFQTMAENVKCQKTGYVFILNLKDYCPHQCGDRIAAKKTFLLIRECVPIRLKAYHTTYGSQQTPAKIVEPHIRQMQGSHIRLHLVHHYGTDEANLESMSHYGFVPKHLSRIIGGDRTLIHHYRWLQERDELEAKRNQTQKQLDHLDFGQFEEEGTQQVERLSPATTTQHKPRGIIQHSPARRPTGTGIRRNIFMATAASAQ